MISTPSQEYFHLFERETARMLTKVRHVHTRQTEALKLSLLFLEQGYHD